MIITIIHLKVDGRNSMDKGLDQFYKGFNEGLDKGKDELLNAVYALLYLTQEYQKLGQMRLEEKIAEAIREHEAQRHE